MATAVGTVFRCVASRNRERVPLGTPTRPDGGEIRPRARPPRRVAPGRQGRQLCESRPTQPNFSAQDSPAFLRIQPPRRGERPTPPPAEGRNVRAAHFRPPLATAEKLQFESNCTHRAHDSAEISPWRASRPPSAGSATRTARGYTRRAAAPENYSAPQSLPARLGDSFYFAECEIVESLLRRGARGFSPYFAI
jgi:hypothetical protein